MFEFGRIFFERKQAEIITKYLANIKFLYKYILEFRIFQFLLPGFKISNFELCYVFCERKDLDDDAAWCSQGGPFKTKVY